MSRSDRELVADALQHIEVLKSHLVRVGLDDQTVADAVCLRLAAALEALARGSTEMRLRLFGDDWSLMWATQNRITHGYAFIDRALIQATVSLDRPWLEACLHEECADRS